MFFFAWYIPRLKVIAFLKHGKNISIYGGQCQLMALSLFYSLVDGLI